MLRHVPTPVVLCAALLGWMPLWTHSKPAMEATGLRDLAGKTANPFDLQGVRFAVFVFLRVDCPVANVYCPEIQRLAKQYAASGVAFRLVYCDPDETADVIGKHLAEFGYAIPALRDPEQIFAKRSQVKMTPEAAVYQTDGKLLYHGRIDDRYADYGKARPNPTERDLARALDAAVAGKPVPPASGAAIGCFIEGL